MAKKAARSCKGKNVKCKDCEGRGCGNLLMPCPIRDNSRWFYKTIEKVGAIPFDKGAAKYKELIKKGIMPAYNDACHKFLDPLWEKYYLNNNKKKNK